MEESLGKKLAAAREAAGITIDDAVYLAKMPRDVVHALESDDFSFFSSPLYARSFLKQYSEYVGTNVDPWLADLVPISLIDGDSLESFIDLSDPITTERPDENDPETKKEPATGGGVMAAIWMIVITGGLIFGGVKIYEQFESTLEDSQTDNISAEEAPKVIDPQTEPVSLPVNEPILTSATSLPESQPPAQTRESETTTVATVAPEPARRAIIVEED